ncbi:BTA121 domain-containing protein surface lipoprotein [Borrelia crocidurae]|uniref:Putative lipoprotein n=1 Tax=Borrelia crocidurae (strain Achema) TaxID=1155096 RepID=I0FEA5_BORCA|nr:hypothetical protein [Borrelia crocidurae]AFI31811.1 Putative lipoprotein [Borrelia crocidurae str. Achema]
MQKLLLLTIISYLLMSCNPQAGQNTNNKDSRLTPPAKDQSKINEKVENITKQLPLDTQEALIFLTKILNNDTIEPNISIYTDEEINNFIIHLGPQKIKDMVINIVLALKIIKNIEAKIQEINVNNLNKNVLIDELRDEINKYKIALKRAANQEFFDIAKINIQNTPITEIIDMQKKVKRAVDAQEKIIKKLEEYKHRPLNYLIKAITNENTKKYDNYNKFNKFLLYIGVKKVSDMLINIKKHIICAESAARKSGIIKDEIQKTKLNNQLSKIHTDFKKSLREAFEHDDFDIIEQNINNVSYLDEFEQIETEAKRIFNSLLTSTPMKIDYDSVKIDF